MQQHLHSFKILTTRPPAIMKSLFTRKHPETTESETFKHKVKNQTRVKRRKAIKATRRSQRKAHKKVVKEARARLHPKVHGGLFSFRKPPLSDISQRVVLLPPQLSAAFAPQLATYSPPAFSRCSPPRYPAKLLPPQHDATFSLR